MKRPLCFCLSLVLMLCAVLSLPGTALATQSRSEYFLGYTPTGNPANDMAQLAMTQLGRTQSQFTYTEPWCADFVSDCAKILGQSDAVPFNGSCTYLYNAVINAGGYEVAAGSRQPGDLVFYNFDHVGIMSSYSNCVSGNMWTSGTSKVEDWSYTSINSGSTIRIVRPIYKTTLDVNFYVNGADTLAIDGIGSFSITVGGTTYSNQTDFAQRVPVGTSYSISNIQASSGYVYTGVSQGALSGTAEKWTYTLRTTETTTSKDPALEGWTKTGYTTETTASSTGTVKYADFPSGFNQNDSVYQSYNHSRSVNTETETTVRVFSDPSFWSYCYWHWCWVDSVGGSDRNVLIEDHYGTVNGKDYIYFDRIVTTFNMSTEGMSTSGLKSFDGLWSSYHHPDYNLPEYASWWWYRFTIYQQSYSDYAKIFTYTKTTDQSKESTTKPSGDGVINVQRWVKYSF